MKNWWISFKEEAISRVFSSKKRIIKTIGISIVPILYAIVCILAFWNPTDNIGKAPIAIVNQDHEISVLVKDVDYKPTNETRIDALSIGVLDDNNFELDEQNHLLDGPHKTNTGTYISDANNTPLLIIDSQNL